ncbi:hypothetical protein [Corallococcus sp. Z5C101001]|uniref:hypothetical protein n=1 Tax=Corallococcus sp. Z5C101001 TaxID=2596829 RepID=UPI00117C8D95|nr:hypothetical protein [Corallococcus sp. Z5C101001]TSC29379.1 hypothetical protein FOF48_15785 [Corallococcus sp. Z5C101001]
MVRARARWWLLMLLLLGGCQCGDGPNVGGASASFRPQDTVVDFGRVLEGTQVRRSLTLVATGRAGVQVEAVTDAPFFVVVSQIVVTGSGTGTVDILFSAGSEPVEGELVLTAGRTTAKVKLVGVGVRPLPCVPQGECRESRFDLESGLCIESPQADGASCIPSSRCQENGTCQAGVCVGRPRTCNDDNPCTVDSCSPTQGCVTEKVVCPPPRDPCKAGVCDRNVGCKEVDVADFSPCGAVSCQRAEVCISGTCRSVTPPDGFVCAPATPCQDEGTCQEGACVRPDAGDLEAVFSAALGGEPVAEDGGPVLLADDDTVYASVCGEDAGCWLAAYTDRGLLRYESPYADGGARTLLAASGAGVVVLAPEALEAYAPRGAGELRWRAPLGASVGALDAGVPAGVPGTGAGRVALTAEGEVLTYVTWSETPFAGAEARRSRLVMLSADAGVPLAVGPDEPGGGAARLAVDAARGAYLYTPWDGRLAFTSWAPPDADAGVAPLSLDALGAGVPGGAASLALASGRLLVGTQAFVDTDGGVLGALDWDGGVRTLSPLAEPVLVSPGGAVGHAFALACDRTDGLPCPPEALRTVLRAFRSDDGGGLSEVDVLPSPVLPGVFHEAALLQRDIVGVLADVELPDGQRQAWLEWISSGRKASQCSLPGRVHVAGAVFAGDMLHVALRRDGVWLLESYPLGGRTESRGWPLRHASPGGSRRAAP